ncbi:MAG TPA: UdgX family uracil-DNA binding protein [Acidimicrobiales bacterium]|nr:UdgX family uracil-DNA binding protein [Acidimicrobiales bacterium]
MDAADFLPERPTLPSLRTAAAGCRGCDLYERASQTVFGDGTPRASLMLVGEQPGDMEDRQGEPFVGPAGRVLDDGLEQAGIDRGDVYLTNAVKHFKWKPSGKRRLHQRPSAREVQACRPWLMAEIGAVKPELVLCLGATAASSLLGNDFRVTRARGVPLERDGLLLMATVHPSAILRAAENRVREMAAFVADLRQASAAVAQLKSS